MTKGVLSGTSRIFVLLLVLLLTNPVLAYVGPGAGLGMLGSLIGVVVAALLALLGLVVIPLRMWFRRRKAQKTTNSRGTQ